MIAWLALLASSNIGPGTVYMTHSRHHPVKPFEFPAGGRILASTYRFVALYGYPGSSVLGILGHQPMAQTIDKAKQLATEYQPLSTQPIYPTLEIITTVAAGDPTSDGNYSREVDPATLVPWIQAAQKAGVYVVLDLQPGRTDFLTQAKQYESLLTAPNVGLALDTEWRLGPNQLPLEQIGSVDASEINSVAAWLSGLTNSHKLPQKLLLLHQFRLDMIINRAALNTSYDNLAYMIQMDGQGSQPAKQSTWRTITADAPAKFNFGWKNFYDKDSPMLSPADTMTITPQPWYISYQ